MAHRSRIRRKSAPKETARREELAGLPDWAINKKVSEGAELYVVDKQKAEMWDAQCLLAKERDRRTVVTNAYRTGYEKIDWSKR